LSAKHTCAEGEGDNRPVNIEAVEKISGLRNLMWRGPELQTIIYHIHTQCANYVKVAANMVLPNLDSGLRSMSTTKQPTATACTKERAVEEGQAVDGIQPVRTDQQIYRPTLSRL